MKKLLPILFLLAFGVSAQVTITNIVPTRLYAKGDFKMPYGKEVDWNGASQALIAETDNSFYLQIEPKGSNQPDSLVLSIGAQDVVRTVRYNYKQNKIVLGAR